MNVKYAPSQTALMQLERLLPEFHGPFPYADCRTLLGELRGNNSQQGRRYEDLIPDLNSYFYNVYSYASGISQVLGWDGPELFQAREKMRRSFFQVHARYKAIEWMINQIGTPELHRKLGLSNQIRLLLVELITQRLIFEQQVNIERQELLLTTVA